MGKNSEFLPINAYCNAIQAQFFRKARQSPGTKKPVPRSGCYIIILPLGNLVDLLDTYQNCELKCTARFINIAITISMH